MKSVRNIVFLSLFFMLVVLGGCASKEEMDKGKQFEAIAEPIIKQYVEENFNEYEVKSISDIYKSEELFISHATEFVKASIENDENSFNIIYDTENNEIYSNFESDKKLNSIVELFNTKNIVDSCVGFLHKDSDKLGETALNYYKIGDTDKAEYDLYIFIKLKENKIPIEIYDSLDKLIDINYRAKIVLGDKSNDISRPTFITTGMDIDKNISRSECTLLSIVNQNGSLLENIRKLKKLELKESYIIYDELRYAVNTINSNTKLGISESKESTGDYKIHLRSLDSSNTNSVISVFSKKYSNIVYLYNDTLETSREDMNSFNILTLSPTYYKSLELSNPLSEHTFVLALFNEENKQAK